MKFSYSEFISIITSLQLQIIMNETPEVYYLTAYNGPLLIRCDLVKSTNPSLDQIDFENNYKPNVNGQIRSEIKGSIKIIGADSLGNETNSVDSTANNELKTADFLNTSVTQAVLSVSSAGSPVEVKAGVLPLQNRKSIIIQAQGSNVVYGFSSSLQPFQLPNGSLVVLSVGDGISVWVDRSSGAGPVNVAIAEFA